jgi:hypothetical protein
MLMDDWYIICGNQSFQKFPLKYQLKALSRTPIPKILEVVGLWRLNNCVIRCFRKKSPEELLLNSLVESTVFK